jgi:polyhydroxybutyrate depolymerase
MVTWTVDYEVRQAAVYAPSALPSERKLPVVLAFHGRGSNITQFQYTFLDRAMPEAIVVYFQGLSDAGIPGWQVERGQNSDRDLKLVDTALAWLRAKYAVDEDRVYAVGFSNGAAFTYLLWAERRGPFAAFAIVSGRARSVRPQQPRPVFHIAGEQDEAFVDQQATVAISVEVNGVGSAAGRCGNGCTVYGAETPAPVKSLVHSAGHEYPQEISPLIASFFRDHPRTP